MARKIFISCFTAGGVRVMRVMAAVLVSGILAVCAPGVRAVRASYFSQLQPGDLDYRLVTEMERRGCIMTEDGMAAFLRGQGGGIGDAQAIISNLAYDEAIVPASGNSFRLVGWERC